MRALLTSLAVSVLVVACAGALTVEASLLDGSSDERLASSWAAALSAADDRTKGRLLAARLRFEVLKFPALSDESASPEARADALAQYRALVGGLTAEQYIALAETIPGTIKTGYVMPPSN